MISFVIPAYNAERTIERCIGSLAPYLSRGCEVIVVDDGSTDSTSSRLASLSRLFPSLVVIDQENQGQSAARNAAIRRATRPYVWCVDADDWIADEGQEAILSKLAAASPDVVVLGRVEEFCSRTKRTPNLTLADFSSGEDFLISAIRSGVYRTQPWNMIVRRQHLLSHGVEFAHGRMFEDYVWCLRVLLPAAHVSVLPVHPYHYNLIDAQSLTHQIRQADVDAIWAISEGTRCVKEKGGVLKVESLEHNRLIFSFISSTIMKKYVPLYHTHALAREIVGRALSDSLFQQSVRCVSKGPVPFPLRMQALLLRFAPWLYRSVLQVALRVMAIFLLSLLIVPAPAQRRYTNPVVNNACNQPDITVFSPDMEQFYMCYTHPVGKGVLYESRDLISWQSTEKSPYPQSTTNHILSLAHQLDPSRENIYLWAPHVIKNGDHWLMYTSLEGWGGLFVMRADKAEGPYDFVGTPYMLLTPQQMQWAYDAIDPCVVQDEDGHWHMFFGSSFGIYRVRLTDDGLHILPDSKPEHVAGTLNPVPLNQEGENGGMEGAYVFQHEGWWYLICSRRLDYSLYVGRSRNIEGPYLNKEGQPLTTHFGTRMSHASDTFLRPGHNGEIFQDARGRYYIFYHATTGKLPGGKWDHRQPILSRMRWDRQGFPYIDGDTPSRRGSTPRHPIISVQ